MAHRAGARVLIDGAQSVPHMPVDVQALDADFFVFSGHKIFGPTGIGVALRQDARCSRTMPPWQGGGNMIADVTFERTTVTSRRRSGSRPAPATSPTPSGSAPRSTTSSGIGLRDDRRLRARPARLRHRAARRRSRAAPRSARRRRRRACCRSCSTGYATEEVGAALNEEGIAVRSGHHCAQPILRRFGLEATVRPSLAFYNTLRRGRRLPEGPAHAAAARMMRRACADPGVQDAPRQRRRGMTASAKRRISASNGWNCSMKSSMPASWKARDALARPLRSCRRDPPPCRRWCRPARTARVGLGDITRRGSVRARVSARRCGVALRQREERAQLGLRLRVGLARDHEGRQAEAQRPAPRPGARGDVGDQRPHVVERLAVDEPDVAVVRRQRPGRLRLAADIDPRAAGGRCRLGAAGNPRPGNARPRSVTRSPRISRLDDRDPLAAVGVAVIVPAEGDAGPLELGPVPGIHEVQGEAARR